MENPCGRSLIRGAAVLVGSVAAIVVGHSGLGSGVHVEISWQHRNARLTTRRRSFVAAIRCNFNGG
jgi:hypothetical protein